MTGQVTKAFIVSIAIMLAACQQAQTSPVAPSNTVPVSVPQPGLVRPIPTFGIALNDNGGVAYLNETWTSTLAVTASDPFAVPASVDVRCGAGAAIQTFSGFVGTKIIGCTFTTRGEYVVIASVVAPNAVTTSTVVPLLAVPRPVPEPPPPSDVLSISATRLGGPRTDQEWRFFVLADPVVTDFSWAFGDGAGAGDSRVQQHIYHVTQKTFVTVGVTATHPTRGRISGALEIALPF